MGDGTFNYFYRPNTSSAFIGRNKLQTLEFNGTQWIFNDGEAEIRYTFGQKGLLQEQLYRNGWRLIYGYNTQDLLAVVQNNFGQSLQFTYGGAPNGALISVTSSDQRSVSLMYSDTGFLTSVRQADGTTIQYAYTNATAKVGSLLAGRIDEQGVRYTTFKYDAEGWALSTEKAGGVDKYTVPTKDWYVDPLGTSRSHTFRIYGNELIFIGSSPAPASPSEPPIYARTVREDGLIEHEYQQFYTNQSTYQWDAPRRLPVSITEAVGTPESRTTQITWHPQWRLPLSITEPGRTTTYAYDSLGNPLTQTITDTGGGSGSSGTTRTTTWTYHASGLVATETAPNGATTSYQYDSAGNLTRATNALGHVDTYTHDGAGRVLTHTGPTGLVTTYTYDARGRMLTANRGGQLTTLTYRPSGQVATASLPHGHVVTYTYDTAQRLTGWSDNRGNSGAYTLDAMGNRTREDLRNAQGQLVWRLARTINSINRVETITLGSQTTTYGYDNNGDWVGTTNSLGQGTSLGLDALRRTKAITNAENATASLSYNALDGVTQASDFKGVATTYSRDALGNATTETSPDTGTEAAQYDALGLPKTVTDALGQATTIERDLLGRPTLITHADGRTTTLRYDLTAASKGYLGEILDPSGTTTYERDAHGRVTTKTQRLINGDTRSVSYAYNTQGLLASTTYPGGHVLQNVYNATGQLIGLTWAGQLLVTGITWNPLGQPTGWSWTLPGGTAPIPATRTYNTAGQLTATDFSSYQYDAAGRIQTLTQKLWRPASTNPQATTISQTTSTWTVQYSPAGRIVGFTKTTAANAPVDTATFSYDANGNRTASTRDLAGTATSRTYGGDASHNRLLGFEQTATSATGNTATTSVTYQYNNAGDLLGDGLTTYRYDSEGRMESASTGQGEDAPTTKYAQNGLGQRVFKTEPLYSSTPASGSSNKNLNNLLADDDDEPQAEPPGLIQQILSFFSKLWSPSTSDAEKLGYSYVYAEDGSLLGEYGSGGSNSTGTAQYIYLPTANGPMPIAAVIKGQTYAVHSDHLNTPRKLTQPDGQVAWQWAYSAFGDEQPTIGAKRFTSETTNPTTGATSIPEVTFNLRYPGQYFDKETKLHYNYFRTYAPSTGRYTQGDPIGLDGGWNRFGYVDGNPLSYTDPLGLCPCGDPAAAAKKARSYEGSSKWRYDVAKGRFRENTNKCNLFVEDVLKEIGSNVPDMNGWLTYNGPTAGQWGDPKVNIPGYPVVENPQPGDVVAISRRYGDASGHVGIVVEKGRSASQSSITDLVEVNSWGFRPGEKPVFRRCSCSQK
ncbi:RHS repeat-associated core domain-containing protein [Acidovorax facilis]|uniref:RHS repeat-associated core domain-containing protein n=1 Tax=Acidovorax facilis TaxID=12917 RepID=UPI003CED000E